MRQGPRTESPRPPPISSRVGQTMQEADVRLIVRAVLDEERRRRPEMDEVVLKTVAAILKSFGLQEEDTREIKLDFQHLRRWRKTTEQIERLGWKAFATSIVALVSTFVVGLAGLIWLGIQAKLGK